MMEGVKRLIKPAAAALIYIAVFLTVERWDYPVSVFLTEHSLPLIDFIGSRFGPLPAVLIPAWSILVLGEYREKNRIFRIAALAVLGIGAFNTVKPDLSSMLGILMMILIWAVYYALVRLFPIPEFTEYRERVMWFSITVTYLSQGIVQLMKLIWGRPRYYAIQKYGLTFHRWYEIAGLAWRSDRFRSFPSGHTVSAAAVFLILFLPRLFPEKHWKTGICFLIAALYTVFVASTRIFAGMHFLSDVLAGCGVFLLTMAADALYMRSRGRPMFGTLESMKKETEPNGK